MARKSQIKEKPRQRISKSQDSDLWASSRKMEDQRLDFKGIDPPLQDLSAASFLIRTRPGNIDQVTIVIAVRAE